MRQAAPGETSGYVYLMDLGTGEILGTLPIPASAYRHLEDNPRGGLRGARGVSRWQDRVAVANTERVMVFDADWQLTHSFTHPLMGGVHDVLAVEEGVWVTCTGADLLVLFNWEGEVLDVWDWRRHPALAGALDHPGVTPVDRTLDYRDPSVIRAASSNLVHLNAVSADGDGLLLSFGRILAPSVERRRGRQERLIGVLRALKVEALVRRVYWALTSKEQAQAGSKVAGSSSAIVRVDADGTPHVLRLETDTRVPNHNALRAGPWTVFNDTNAGALVGFRDDGRTRRVEVPGEPSFARGLAHLGGLTFAVGSQRPAAVHLIDLERERLVGDALVSERATETVYDLALLPPPFRDADAFERALVAPAEPPSAL